MSKEKDSRYHDNGASNYYDITLPNGKVFVIIPKEVCDYIHSLEQLLSTIETKTEAS